MKLTESKLRSIIREELSKFDEASSAQRDLFGTPHKGNPQFAIRNADRFEIHDKTPEDFGKHFEDHDISKIVAWLERSRTPSNYEVTAYKDRNVLEVIPADVFLRLARNTDITARP